MIIWRLRKTEIGGRAVLLAVCGYFLKRELDTNDLYRWETAKAITTLQVDVTDLKTRMGLLEDRTRENHQLLDQISRQTQPTGGP
jgi:hypothetical protein